AQQAGSPPVLMLTAFGDIDDAVAAMKLGAIDYLQKPCDIEQIVAVARQLRCDPIADAIDRKAPPASNLELVGDSPAMQQLKAALSRIAALSARSAQPPPTILLVGETGVGKGLVARNLHARSGRRNAPFIQVDCAALPRELIESELFGHRKGAFTGAHRDKPGLIEQAAGGTLFLDEIGELPLDLQSKLLAVLDRRRVRRVGDTSEYETDAWFITATHRDLSKLSADQQFRQDLYFRLSPLTIEIPALRDRPSDIAALTRHYLQHLLAQYQLDVHLSEQAEAALLAHTWPGNVRELIGVIERALFTNQSGIIEAPDLGLNPATSAASSGAIEDTTALRDAERKMIRRTLEQTGGNVSAAARQLGMTRMMLRYRIDKFGLGGKAGSDDAD
ncbi:MAG: sigma-54-dependent Fis family transcriptional regulator, partial [Gammaproteobacteria bacterium]|nr:sigma-54-dependent Fis family transcriptional regulator [Gammaproteobacteria bacterium]